MASLRFDLRGFGESDGRQEELTLAAILNQQSQEWQAFVIRAVTERITTAS